MKVEQAVLDKIVVEVLVISKTKGGIIIPQTHNSPNSYGRVVSVGSEVPEEIAIGKVLVFHSKCGQVLLIDNKEFRVLMKNEVYAIMSEEGNEELTPVIIN